ncbi:MAG TPA: GyrI-like domain-containing protein [Candidatus Lokiarchaeia archaeon]|nr:GyrI-like domain-containing protein [Candidatus Lokiarchaeia archaeon]
MPTKKHDFKKEFPALYNPTSKNITIVDVPEMKFFMIDGQGDPNTAQEFKDAIATLFPLSYGVKMPFKKNHPDLDYIVPPLEGLWFMEDMAAFSMASKDLWLWTLMMRVPDFVPDDEAISVIEKVMATKHPPAIDKVRFERYNEGKCMQIMYVGPFDAEPPAIQKMHEWARENGFEIAGKHHEIYLSDLRRTAPEKLRTVLRQPIA